MVMVIHKKILRAFLAHKSRYIGLFLLIMFSCLSFTAFQLVAPSALGTLDDFWQKSNVEDAHFTLHHPLTNITSLEQEFNLQLEENRHFDYEQGNATLRIFQDTETINKYGVVAGEKLQAPGDILIDRLYANSNRITIGSTIHVGEQSFRVVGYMTRPDYMYTLKNHYDIMAGSFGIGVLGQEDFETLPRYQKTYSVLFQQENQEEFRSYLSQHNTLLSWLDREDNNRITAVEPDIRAKETIGTILPTFILIVTCLIVAVVLWRLLKTELVQIGTLYALGYKRSDILKHYLIYPSILWITGSLFGTLLGIRLSVPLVMVTDGFQYNFPPIQLTILPAILAISLVLPGLFLMPTTWLVIRRALKLSPQELMRGAGHKTEVSWLEQRLQLNRFRFDTKFRIRELLRNIPRVLAMIIGITFASSLLLVGFVMNDSIRDVLETGYSDLYRYGYQYTFRGLQFDAPDGVERQAMISADAWTEKEKARVVVYGIETEGELLNLTSISGAPIRDTISITQPLAQALNIQADDTVILHSKVNNLETELVIQEIADTYMGYFIYMPLHLFNQTFGMPEGSYTILLSDEPLDVDKALVHSVITREELQEGFQELMGLLRVFISIVALFAVAIGIIIIYILTSLLIEENRYNISLMKVLGYGKGKISALILNTNVILVLLGFLLSIPLIRVFANAVFEEVAEEMNLGIPAIISANSLLFGLIIIIVTFYTTNLISRRKVWAVSMADSLKNRED